MFIGVLSYFTLQRKLLLGLGRLRVDCVVLLPMRKGHNFGVVLLMELIQNPPTKQLLIAGRTCLLGGWIELEGTTADSVGNETIPFGLTARVFFIE